MVGSWHRVRDNKDLTKGGADRNIIFLALVAILPHIVGAETVVLDVEPDTGGEGGGSGKGVEVLGIFIGGCIGTSLER